MFPVAFFICDRDVPGGVTPGRSYPPSSLAVPGVVQGTLLLACLGHNVLLRAVRTPAQLTDVTGTDRNC